MCSLQSVYVVNNSFHTENWEDELWANVLSPNPNVSDTSSNQSHYSDRPTAQVVCDQNSGPSTTISNCQIQDSSQYQNVESILSPTWENCSHDNAQHSTNNMSTYFSTFNPLSQSQDMEMYEGLLTQTTPNVMTTKNTFNKNKYGARIQFVPAGNGAFKTIVKRKRKRTVFTTEQLEILEEVFSKKPYVNRDDREILVEKLQVNDKSIKVWFQNRRLKYKRSDQDDVMESDSCSTIFDRIDTMESKIKERTDENGYVTLDDKIVNELVNIIDDYFTNRTTPVQTENENASSPIYEPISPASTSDYSCEESVTRWQHCDPDDSIQKLIDIDSIISS